MDPLIPDGSPTPRKKSSVNRMNFFIHDEDDIENDPKIGGGYVPLKRDSISAQSDVAQPLTTSRLANQMPPPITMPNASFKKQRTDPPIVSANTNPVPVVPTQAPFSSSPMDELLARLAEQEAVLNKQKLEHQHLNAQNHADESRSSSRSGFEQPNTDPHATTPRTGSHEASGSPPDLLRLKQELEMAQTKIARMDQELNQSRITKHTLEQAMGSQFDADFDHTRDLGLRPHSRVDGWVQSTRPGPPPPTNGAPADNGIWNAGPNFGMTNAGIIGQGLPVSSINNNNGWLGGEARGCFNTGHTDGSFYPTGTNLRQQMPALRLDTAGLGPYYSNDQSPNDFYMRSSGNPSRPASAFGNHLQPWGSFSTNGNGSDQTGITPPLTPMPFSSMQAGMPGMPQTQPIHPMQHMQDSNMMQNNLNTYMPRPIGTRLSPTAMEFHGTGGFPGATPWNMQPQARPSSRLSRTSTDNAQGVPEPPASYMSTAEPMNYRRLLDRNMSCNWKYIVDKIVHSNDQQASIFLQQKLKVGTAEQKFEIVQAIIDQAYSLMINRFGNFLVQRCFEHGTPEQVIAIARAIRGNTLNLSMDAFGCHVVQKAFDCVPEEFKAIMVHELLRRIPETVIHRYACHVWQKLFELRWSDSPPQIMKYVNEALRGMWHEVALGETGSLVVQNIFENCLEEDKRPCINEVLASIDVVAHGQFGNWCIQHICEHGAPPDRTRAVDHVLRFATEYSMDQFASKVVEKCLKIGGVEFLDRYLDRVCEARPDRPRMPLIDISGDQFGNYLIQYILTHADPQRREIVAAHIRKHMVSLRGSKYGSRVAMLCCNPAVATRPGPPVGLPMGGMGRNGGHERPFYRGAPYGGGAGGFR